MVRCEYKESTGGVGLDGGLGTHECKLLHNSRAVCPGPVCTDVLHKIRIFDLILLGISGNEFQYISQIIKE